MNNLLKLNNNICENVIHKFINHCYTQVGFR